MGGEQLHCASLLLYLPLLLLLLFIIFIVFPVLLKCLYLNP